MSLEEKEKQYHQLWDRCSALYANLVCIAKTRLGRNAGFRSSGVRISRGRESGVMIDHVVCDDDTQLPTEIEDMIRKSHPPNSGSYPIPTSLHEQYIAWMESISHQPTSYREQVLMATAEEFHAEKRESADC